MSAEPSKPGGVPEDTGRFAPPVGSARYAHIATFYRCPFVPNAASLDVTLMGCPYDGGASFRPGARFGPRAVRNASCLSRGYSAESGRNIFAEFRVGDVGDIDVSPYGHSAMLATVQAAVAARLSDGASPAVVGGDHSITLPILRAAAARHGPLALIHFDAHSDTYGPAFGADHHHGSPFRHAIVEGLIQPAASSQLGVRGQYNTSTDLDFARQSGLAMFTADDLAERARHIMTAVAERAAGHPCYVSFDIDFLDPAFAPGTGTPSPGGISSRAALKMLRGLQGVDVVACDVVEVCPPHDVAELTSLAASAILYELVAVLLLSREARRGRVDAASRR